jgi:hypothetical protein
LGGASAQVVEGGEDVGVEVGAVVDDGVESAAGDGKP